MIETATLVAQLDRFFDALEAGDRGEVRGVFVEIADPDCVFDSAVGSIIEGRIFRGTEEILGWTEELVEGFEVRYSERRYERIAPEILTMTYDFSLTSRSTGLPLEYPASLLCRLRDGMIVSTTTFRSHEGAREAASSDA